LAISRQLRKVFSCVILKYQVWQRSHALTVAVYKATAVFPKEKVYGLTSQIRRASASIPANIAEGCGRGGEVAFARFLTIACGSASEFEYHFLLCRDIGRPEPADFERLDAGYAGLKKMLSALLKKLKTIC
jgi:four helix bundle protein